MLITCVAQKYKKYRWHLPSWWKTSYLQIFPATCRNIIRHPWEHISAYISEEIGFFVFRCSYMSACKIFLVCSFFVWHNWSYLKVKYMHHQIQERILLFLPPSSSVASVNAKGELSSLCNVSFHSQT